MKRYMIVLTLAVFVVAGFGCSRAQKGGVIGAGAGAAIGAGIGKATGKNTAVAAIIGAAVGGTAGTIIGKQMDKQAAEIEADLAGARVERIGEGIKITFDSGILFDVNKAALRPVAQSNLQSLAGILNKYPDTDVLIEGHTDSTGSDEWNLELSKMRAESVSGYLGGLAVDPRRFTIMGYGEAQPIATNDTAEGRQANRRVELAIMANQKLKKAAEAQAAKGAPIKSIFAAELFGTFFLTFIGAGAILQSTALGDGGYGLLGIALANGVGLSVAVTATMRISGGQINPAVTLALWLSGKVKTGAVPVYVVAQVLGSFLAALLLRSMFAGEVIDAARLGTPTPAAAVGTGTVVIIEIVLTFLLMVSIWGTAVDRRAPAIGGFGIGLCVLANILVGGPITGAAMNPARVLGPALAGGYWDAHAAYWIGPIVGAVAGSFFYKVFLLEE